MASTTAYCDLRAVQRIMSVAGINLRVDDDPAVYPTVIDEASREVDLYLLHRYDEANLPASRWVEHCTATVAAWLFCTRRGNPAPTGIQKRYEHYLERLEKIASGLMHVPGLAPRRTDVPTLSNVRVRLDPFPRTVVERTRGGSRNHPQDYTQHLDSREWFDYGAGI